VFKSAALAIVLLTNVHALNLNARTQGKHDFIKAMRKSQKVNGKLPRKLSNDKPIAKSVHKPGPRSSTTQTLESTKTATESSGSATVKSQLPTKRHLNSDWWKWWKSDSDLTDEEAEYMNDMDEEDFKITWKARAVGGHGTDGGIQATLPMKLIPMPKVTICGLLEKIRPTSWIILLISLSSMLDALLLLLT